MSEPTKPLRLGEALSAVVLLAYLFILALAAAGKLEK